MIKTYTSVGSVHASADHLVVLLCQRLVTRQAEVEELDRGLKTKEKEIEAREQWLMQKEGEQRAMGTSGGRTVTPRDVRRSPRDCQGRDTGLHHVLAPIDQVGGMCGDWCCILGSECFAGG